MDHRQGEKIGWIVGWTGGFIWVMLLAVIFLFQGKPLPAIVGFALFGFALFMIFLSAPWTHPNTQYWKLMLPVYVLFFVSVAWAVLSFGGFGLEGNKTWGVFLVFPVLIPLGTAGGKRWRDYDG